METNTDTKHFREKEGGGELTDPVSPLKMCETVCRAGKKHVDVVVESIGPFVSFESLNRNCFSMSSSRFLVPDLPVCR